MPLPVQTRRLCLHRGLCSEVLCASTWWGHPGIYPPCWGAGEDGHRLRNAVVTQRLCCFLTAPPATKGLKPK